MKLWSSDSGNVSRSPSVEGTEVEARAFGLPYIAKMRSQSLVAFLINAIKALTNAMPKYRWIF